MARAADIDYLEKYHPELIPSPMLVGAVLAMVWLGAIIWGNLHTPKDDALLRLCQINKQVAPYQNKDRYTVNYTIEKPFLQKQYISLAIRDKINHINLNHRCYSINKKTPSYDAWWY